VPGVPVLPTTTSESMHFGSFRDASNKSELAVALFRTEGVTGVFLTRDFISVNKTPETHWHELKPMIFAVITDFFESGRPVLSSDGNTSTANTAITDEDDDIVAMIKELLETRVRPAVQADGGDIIYRGFTDGVVLLQMQGSCQGCPSSAVTLKKGMSACSCIGFPRCRASWQSMTTIYPKSISRHSKTLNSNNKIKKKESRPQRRQKQQPTLEKRIEILFHFIYSYE
jgi:Fe-S cluster biogenesis protein NfuA